MYSEHVTRIFVIFFLIRRNTIFIIFLLLKMFEFFSIGFYFADAGKSNLMFTSDGSSSYLFRRKMEQKDAYGGQNGWKCVYFPPESVSFVFIVLWLKYFSLFVSWIGVQITALPVKKKVWIGELRVIVSIWKIALYCLTILEYFSIWLTVVD